jgi:DNA polymerase III subunit epsilon
MNAAHDRHAHAAELLRAHPDFRVQRRLMPVTAFHEAAPFVPSRIGVAIDVETTGLNHDADRNIELAVQRFRFDAARRVIQVGTLLCRSEFYAPSDGFPVCPPVLL